ncbi:MAG: hypothetical protein M1826_001992 [Phylliscum demangeonii]|nr:MAG: hypothetical protein M1826_001992 [Phylliscum demangeonii]
MLPNTVLDAGSITSDTTMVPSIALPLLPLHLPPVLGSVTRSTADAQGAATSSFEPTTPPPMDQLPLSRHTLLSATASGADDVEGQRPATYADEKDPYHLARGIRPLSEIALIRPEASRTRHGCVPSVVRREGYQTRRLRKFYRSQNENIERLLKPVDEHRRQAKELHGENQVRFQIAVHGSLAANLALAGLQLYAAAASGSLSLFTTMADAVFDPLSNLTLLLSHRAMNSVDARRFPSGKARIETAANIVFCFLMCSVSFILLVTSIRDLAEGSRVRKAPFHMAAIVAVSIALVTKICLFLYCWTLRKTYSQIRILWEDHRNDIIINGVGILTSLGGSQIRWWIDPAGAVVLSCIIATLWLRTAYREFQLLIGVTADPQLQQLITYVSMTHSPRISQIDTVRAYHSGPRIIVEVDVVMDPEESLRATHDVAEELQSKLESLPDVERAYVHVDYETSHKPVSPI